MKTVLPNERYPVYSKRKDGIYYIGNNSYIIDETGEKVRYEQIPSSILSNIYKRKYNVRNGYRIIDGSLFILGV